VKHSLKMAHLYSIIIQHVHDISPGLTSTLSAVDEGHERPLYKTLILNLVDTMFLAK